MNSDRTKWILFGMLVYPVTVLVKGILCKLGFKIVGEVEFFLFLAVAGFLFVGIIVKVENKKWAKLIPTLCLLMLLSIWMGSCYQSCHKKGKNDDSKNQGQTVMIQTAPTVWQENIEVTGKEVEGKIVSVPKAGWYEISYVDGIIYDTPENKMRNVVYDIWGAEYDPEWKPYFIYSNVPGAKALEALVIVDGEVGSENGKVCQFPDRQKSFKIWVDKYVRFFRHEAFREDINGNKYWCFQNNYGSWRFGIRKVD